jgi:hypothetical protein
MNTPRLSRVLVSALAAAVLAASAHAAPHGILWAQGARPSNLKATAGGGLQYYGGPVISHPKVYAVFWGSNVDSETQSKIGPFFANMLDSTYMDMLAQYGTGIKAVDGRDGTHQTLNRGTFAGNLTIQPINTSTTLSDLDIQHELDAQIAAGNLPAATDDSLYMVYFPSGISISIDAQNASCQSFCAYHEGYKSPKTGSNVFYGVMPVCGFGCGIGGSAFDSMSIVSSHECTEAITDPFPTPGTTPAYPQAWNDSGGQEIGDLCQQGSGTITGHGLTSAAQWEYDNSLGGCNQGPWTQNASLAQAPASAAPRAMPAIPLLDAVRSAPASIFAGR